MEDITSQENDEKGSDYELFVKYLAHKLMIMHTYVRRSRNTSYFKESCPRY